MSAALTAAIVAGADRRRRPFERASRVTDAPTPDATRSDSPRQRLRPRQLRRHPNSDADRRPARAPAAASIGSLANQRFNQMITNRVLGTVLLGVNEQVNCSDCISAFGSAGSFSAGVHGRKELTPNLSLLAGHRLHPIQRGRIQRHQRADRRVRAALRFRRLGIVAAVLRHRHHPVAVREGALQPQLSDEPRRGVARQLDQQHRLRRLWPGRLDQPAFAARRDRRLGRALAVVAAGQRLHRSVGRVQSVRRLDRHRHRPNQSGQGRRTVDASVRQQRRGQHQWRLRAVVCDAIPASSPP